MYFPLCDHTLSPNCSPFAKLDQCVVFVSNNINSVWALVNAEMKRPSGESRGEKSPSEFGMKLIFPLSRSRRKMEIGPFSLGLDFANTTDLPSGAQLGSACTSFGSSEGMLCGTPPDADRKEIFQGR